MTSGSTEKTVHITPNEMQSVSEADLINLLRQRLVQLGNTLPGLMMAKPEEVDGLFNAALTSLKLLAPRDEFESMLASQMITTHAAAMEAFRRAALPDQTFAGRDMNLKHAQKLLALYVRQMEALDKHRGKGQQKITVEHVNVEAGGQAIVGNVTTETKNPAGVLSHEPGQTMPMIDADAFEEPVPVPATQSKPNKRSRKP